MAISVLFFEVSWVGQYVSVAFSGQTISSFTNCHIRCMVTICPIATICIYVFNLNKTFTVLSLSEFLNISASVCQINHIK